MEILSERAYIDRIKIGAAILLVAVLLIVFGLAITAGCVSKGKELYREWSAEETAVPAETVQQPEVYEKIPEPVPEPGNLPIAESYPEWKYRNHQYNLSEWVSWHREDVQGLKDLTMRVTVYDFREMMNYYTWEWRWGGPPDGSADWVNLPTPGNKFLFIFVCAYMDGTDQSQDPSVWGIHQRNFIIQIGENFYPYRKVDYVAPIREFENKYTLFDVERVRPYGYIIKQEAGSGILTAEELGYMRMGRSNAWDGWILFEIPKDTDVRKDVYVHGALGSLGHSVFWRLGEDTGYD